MIIDRNNRPFFFKYLTADSGIAVLSHRTLKWSTAPLLNDPFDNQMDILLNPDLGAMANELYESHIATLTGDKPVEAYNPTHAWVMETFRQAVKSGKIVLTENDLQGFRRDALEGATKAAARMPQVNAEFNLLMADTSLFCVTEDHTNELMWSHYSGQHTGIVFKLVPQDSDSFLTVAQKVDYVERLPMFSSRDFLDVKEMCRKAFRYRTLTKSYAWSYEKEWRVVTSLRDKTKTFELIPFGREELGAVYLGCRISEIDKNKIIELTRKGYPQAEIYQARKNPSEFGLTFEKMPNS